MKILNVESEKRKKQMEREKRRNENEALTFERFGEKIAECKNQ
jgi:hypothetical protein